MNRHQTLRKTISGLLKQSANTTNVAAASTASSKTGYAKGFIARPCPVGNDKIVMPVSRANSSMASFCD